MILRSKPHLQTSRLLGQKEKNRLLLSHTGPDFSQGWGSGYLARRLMVGTAVCSLQTAARFFREDQPGGGRPIKTMPSMSPGPHPSTFPQRVTRPSQTSAFSSSLPSIAHRLHFPASSFQLFGHSRATIIRRSSQLCACYHLIISELLSASSSALRSFLALFDVAIRAFIIRVLVLTS